MKKKLLIFLFAFSIILGGCAATNDIAVDNTVDKSYDFIFVCPLVDNEYWEMCISGIEQADSELGTHTLVVGADSSKNFVEEMPKYMLQAIEAQPDGILAYVGLESLYPLLDEASSNNIPVIAIDSNAPGKPLAAYVGSSDFSLAFEAGQETVKMTGGTGEIAVLVTSMHADREMKLLDIFLDTISDYPIDVLTVEQTNADELEAEKITERLISENPGLKLIFATGSTNITAAGRVKKELGCTDLALIGFDDTEENISLVRDGIIDSLIVQQPRLMGYEGVYLMKEYVDSGALTKDAYYTSAILVNPDNVDTYSNTATVEAAESMTVRVGYYSGDTALQDGYSDAERKSGYAYEYLQNIANYTGWIYEYVYGTRSEIIDKLAAGEIDIAAGVYKTSVRQKEMLFSSNDLGLEGEKRYFAISNRRPELKKELDLAMDQISQMNPYFRTSLFEKYYSSDSYQFLSEAEREWLSEKKGIKLGFVRGELPYCDADENGAATGVVVELAASLEKHLNISVESVCYESISAMEQALITGEIDAAFPLYYDLWANETKGLRLSASFISDRVMLVYKDNKLSNIMESVGICHGSIDEKIFSDSEINYYDTPEQMLKALMDGQEKCIAGSANVMQRLLSEHQEYDDLNIVYLSEAVDYAIGVRSDNIMLSGIINNAISRLDSANITNAMIEYSKIAPSYSLRELIRRNFALVIVVFCIVIAAIVLAFINYRRKVRSFNIKQAETQAALEDALVKAEKANAAKTVFLSSMSHDIRTPMNAITGMSVIAEKNINDSGKVKDCLKKINLASSHLLTLINDILDISKIESNNLSLSPVNFSLRDMLTSLINIVRPQLISKKMDFYVRIHDINYETVYADEVRLNQIFINILSNSVKYTPDGGKITLDLYEEPVEGSDNVRLVYVVEDNGIGMSPEFMKNMYSSFSRASDSRINKIQGTGLGLAIVKRVVEIMDGTIDCESELNKGTKFTIKIEVPVSETASTENDLPALRILLADSDPVFLDTTAAMLNSLGSSCDIAKGGTEAVTKALEADEAAMPYDLYILGHKMPDMSGNDTVIAIEKALGRDIVSIITSAYDWQDMEEEIVESRARALVSKPLFRSGMSEELRKLFCGAVDADIAEQSEYEDLGGLFLLIAEDNDINWEVASEILDFYDIRAERAENGKICVEMLEAAEANKYDAVLMDIQMPVMNGMEAARLIRRSDKQWLKTIPILAMTADAFAEDINSCKEAGMDGHVAKPIDIDTLFQELRKVCK